MLQNNIRNLIKKKNYIKKNNIIPSNISNYTIDIRTYNNFVTKYSTNVAEVPKVEHVKQTAQTFGPYPISSGEFGENGYEPTMTWTHYANGVLVDADGHELSAEEIDRTIGLDYVDHFGDVDDDDTTLYIRNEELQCDFEIFDCGEEEYYPPTINGPSND